MRRWATRTQLEGHLAERLRGHRLVCEVDWEPDELAEAHVLFDISRAAEYPAITLVHLVAYGATHYEANDFWSASGLAPAQQRRAGLAVEEALRRFDLDTFPQFSLPSEKARRFVSVILAHGGIPASAVGRFLRESLLPALRAGDAGSGSELVARWRIDRPRYFPETVRRFLLYGGASAVDLLDRCMALVAAPRADLAARPASYGVPTYIVKAFLDVPTAEVVRATRWPRPVIEFDPGSGEGPMLRLPVLEGREGAVRWEIEDGSGTTVRREVLAGHESLPIPLFPSAYWRIVGACRTETRTFTFECFGDTPIVCFDEQWRYVPDVAGIRNHEMWTIAPRGVVLASVEADGLRLLAGEETTWPLGGAWRGHTVKRHALRGIDLLAVLRDDKEIARIPVLLPASDVVLDATSIEDVAGREGEDVLAALPTVSLPPGQAWHVRLDGPDGVVERELPPADARRRVELRALAEPVVGRYELVVRGERLGEDIRRAFVLVPGLRLEGPTEPLGPTRGDVRVRVSADPGVRFFRQDGAAEVLVAPAAMHAPLLVSGRNHQRHRASLMVSVPRIRWAIRSSSGVAELATTVLPITPALAEAGSTLLLALGRPNRPVRVALIDAQGEQLQELPTRVSDTQGRVTFDLAPLRDTLRLRAADGLGLVAELRSDRVIVARAQVPEQVSQPTSGPHLGETVSGLIREIRPHCVFVDGPGWAGVVYHERLPRPITTYRVGDRIRGKVTRLEAPGVRLDALAIAHELPSIGTTVTASVLRIATTHLAIDLDGIDARVYPEHLPPERPLDRWSVGAPITARVIEVHEDSHVVDLAVAPFEPSGLTIGSVVTCEVVRPMDSGLAVRANGVAGFVPRSLEADGPRATAGTRVTGWLDRVDRRRERLVISCRPFNERGHVVGELLDVVVVSRSQGFLVVELPDGTRGVVHRSAMPAHLDVPDGPPRGTVLRARITKIDATARRIELSVRAASDTWAFGDDVESSAFAVLRDLPDQP